MPHKKTMQELESDLADQIQAAKNTKSPERRRIFEVTAERIRALIAARKAESDAPGAAENIDPQPDAPQDNLGSAAVAEQGFQATNHATGATIVRNKFNGIDPVAFKVKTGTAEGIEAVVAAGSPTVTIAWKDGYTVTGNESLMKSRFAGCLADIAQYTCVRQGRYEKMWELTQPYRAQGYYAALRLFFGRAPSMAEIGKIRPTNTMKIIFENIQNK